MNQTPQQPSTATPLQIAVFCVGNRLMMDDGIGPAVYDQALAAWKIPDNVHFFDVGCLTMDLVTAVNEYDVIITVDAVDGEDDEPGTVYKFTPDDMARRAWGSMSLHDLKLVKCGTVRSARFYGEFPHL